MRNERISLHICTANRPGELLGLLVSVRDQTFQDFDVVIVDDSDKTITAFKPVFDIISRLRLEGHMVKYIKNPFPSRNIGINRNIAIENCPNKIGCRIDDDSVIDKHYLEALYGLIKSDRRIGAAGGIVPPFGHPKMVRDPPEIFNRITFHKDRIIMADDGGYCYDPDVIILSHHLRSSFMYWNEAVRKAGMHPTEYGKTGFREESDLSMRLIMAGYKLLTDTGAICWHAQSPSGGARIPDYQQRIAMNMQHFDRKFLRYRRQGKIKDSMFTMEDGLKW
jgi:GT2 family glycosyltransferase